MRFLEQLRKVTSGVFVPKAKVCTRNTPKPGLSNAPNVSNPVAFILWAESEARHIATLSEPDQREALQAFEAHRAAFDTLPLETKTKAIHLATPATKLIDPFNPTNYPAPSWPVVLPDANNPGYWIAHRGGAQEPKGKGPDQLAAVLNLEEKEEAPC